MRTIFYFLIVLFGVAMHPHQCPGQVVPFEAVRDSLGRQSIFDAMLVNSEELLEMDLTTNLGQLIKKRTVEEYQEASIRYTNPDGRWIEHALEIKARGITRKEICGHPPIKVKWKKKTLDSLGFSKFNEMKVVWQCKPGKSYEQMLLREYMVYRLYNLISPYSYRVRLVKMNVIDSRDTTKQHVKYGFFLEDDDQLCQRLNGKMLDEPVKNTSRFVREHLLRFFVFQYMVGNTDWSFGNMHNVRMMQLQEINKVMMVPYDFDYAGLVSAAYAVPHESLPIKDVRERHYQGIDCTASEIALLNQFFQERKPEILAYAENFPHLDAVSKKDVMGYLGDFFDMLDRKNGLGQFIGELKTNK